jgi:hydrogenase maturation protease
VNVLVAGIGNVFCGDDAFGVAVVHRLRSSRLPQSVRVFDAGVRALALLDTLLSGWDLVVLVDALGRGKPPGTLSLLELEAEGQRSGPLDAHALRMEQVLESAAAMGAVFGRVLLVGCEPECLDTGRGPDPWTLSPRVAAAVEPAATMIERLIRESEVTVA